MTVLLAGDIGGTKTLLALYSCDGSGPPQLLDQRRSVSAEWPDLAALVCDFLAERGGGSPPQAACFAVAGPVQNGRAQLTNLPWRLEERSLAAACAIPRVALVNDFAVLVHGLPQLQPHQQETLHAGVSEPLAAQLVLGAGTGLGVAVGIPTAGGLLALPSEGSHGEFAPRSEAEWQLKRWLLQDLRLERLSSERIVSGTGLGHVARWLLAAESADPQHPLQEIARRWLDPAAGNADLPAQVAALAAAGDPLARSALDLWLSAYGSLTGDLALASLARGGIWLAGGTTAKLLDELRSPRFREPLLAKGRMRGLLEAIPVTAITDGAIGSFSAACLAQTWLG